MAASHHRFFFHYRKCDGQMSVHFRGQCIPCKNVECCVTCQTKYNKRQPYLVLQGWAVSVDKIGDTVLIS